MSESSDMQRVEREHPRRARSGPHPDVCLMLRTHAEMRCLSREVIPVLRQVETHERLPADQVDAALAYLEALWRDAGRLAAATEAAYQELTCALGFEDCEQDEVYGNACRYRAAVVSLRRVVARRVAPLLASPSSVAVEPAR